MRTQIIGLNEAAKRADLHRRTLERELKRSEGLARVQVSQRRFGFIEADFERWLRSRRLPTKAPKKAVDGAELATRKDLEQIDAE